MASVKAHIKQLIPESIFAWRANYLESRKIKKLQGLVAPKDIFTAIYDSGYWGQSADPGERYYSGGGSHDVDVVEPYISAVGAFLRSLDNRPDAVDLGCGDFAVGAQLRPFCGSYIAADVVEKLIERNRSRYAGERVDFRVLDMIHDDLPQGEVVFIRQVLQHLSNSDIASVVSKLSAKYRFLVISEHLPLSGSFVPNLDKVRGPDIRLGLGKEGSGVVLTEEPFNLKVRKTTTLCEVLQDVSEVKGIIRTSLYEL